jgi:hypothetical protein
MKKTTQEILQAEMLRERAMVLERAGEKVTAALERLVALDGEIAAAMDAWQGGDQGEGLRPLCAAGRACEALRGEINGKIRAYNRQREQLRIGYYELVVTREALGLTHHERLEEFYRIPPHKRFLPER